MALRAIDPDYACSETNIGIALRETHQGVVMIQLR